MAALTANILIAEDDPLIASSLKMIFVTLGYQIRTAPNGLSAIAAFRSKIPDILISDLNMPDMSGYELLSIVTRRFPAIRTIAMSGAFGGTQIPEGVAADSYYQKGCGVPALLKAIERAQSASRAEAPPTIWMQRGKDEASAKGHIILSCPDCFRTFSQPVPTTASTVLHTMCAHCEGTIQFAVVPSLDPPSALLPHPSWLYGLN